MAAAKGVQWVLGARSETGYVRAANEDRMGFTRTPFSNVYVVSDGMGGYRGGALAAELTVSTLQERLAALPPDSASFPERVREAFAAANQAVLERRRPDDPDTRDMGATGVVLVTAGARALVGHVGDSRAYLVRHKGRALRRLTRDHTRVQRMLDAGMLTPTQAADHPDASMLDRAIGHQPTVEVDVSNWIELKPRDMILLCSDGLCGYVEDAEIGQVVRSKGSPQDLANKLVDLALEKGGEDNVTVQLVRLGSSATAQWWRRLGQPAIVTPAAMVASAAVVWGVASPLIDTAQSNVAQVRAELEQSKRQSKELQAQVQELSSQVQRMAQARVAAPVPAAPASAPAPAPAPSAPVAPAKRTVVTKSKPEKKTSPRAAPQIATGVVRPASAVSAATSAPAPPLPPLASAPVPAPAPAPAPPPAATPNNEPGP